LCLLEGSFGEIENRDGAVSSRKQAVDEGGRAATDVDDRIVVAGDDMLNQRERKPGLLLVPAQLGRGFRAIDVLPVRLTIHAAFLARDQRTRSKYHSRPNESHAGLLMAHVSDAISARLR
jgi:hypothetical protein